VAVAAALREFAEGIGIGQTLRRYGVMTSWEEIVGEQIARVARPERIEKGILFVSVATAPWRAELSMRRTEILRKVNEHAGTDVIREIRFR
jgi:predicted nucleic acid-binding Zn ribbon protein